MPMNRSVDRNMHNNAVREYARNEYKGGSPEYTASILKDTLPLTESQVKIRHEMALLDTKCLARGSYANGCLYSFAAFGCALFFFKLATLVL